MISLRDMFEKISPVLITPRPDSITIGLSKRFFLFNVINKAMKAIEDDPYLNFISILKNYKILGKFLYGTVGEFYRDRNKLYFKKFFIENEVYELVKSDLEWLMPAHPDIKMTLTKRGVIVYDNYRKNSFNVLLMSIHSGTWVPEQIQKKMQITPEQRYKEEDVDTHRLYSELVLMKSGIWIDNKMSRFACDFNRKLSRAIYEDDSENFIRKVWKEELNISEKKHLYDSHRQFYFTLTKLVDAYRFNIIFDAHSMRDKPGRPAISFGTKFIPKFYLPIVHAMQKKMAQLGYKPVLLNTPYAGGFILQWLSTKFPDVFIFSMEVNKQLYMSSDNVRTIDRKLRKVSSDVSQIFNIEVDA